MLNRLDLTYKIHGRIFPSRLLLVTLALIAACVPIAFSQTLFVPGMALQTSTQSPSASSIPKDGEVRVFDVASVRLNKTGADNDKLQFPPDGFFAENVSLQTIIVAAYHLRDPDLMAGTRLIPGAPNWIKSDRYDLHAKMADSDIAELKNLRSDQQLEEKRLMLQSLLADRFKLTVHREIKEAPVYALIVAKNGPNLKKQPDDSATVYAHSDRTHITYRAAPLSDLAARLAFLTVRPVLDRTGLAGKYDFTMSWVLDQSQSQMSGPAGAQEAAAPPPDSPGPSIFTALQEQLGLKLESTKGPVEILVIDHVERPSEN